MNITGKTRIAAVIGYPIRQSRSPLLHGYWLDRYKIDGAMIPLEISPADIDEALAVLPKLGLIGASVTIPFKENALQVAGDIDAAARAIGAVNMLTVGADRNFKGRNTDSFGFIENIRQCQESWQPDGSALVMGAGGAARAVVYALADAGVSDIVLVNRTKEKAEAVARDLAPAVASKIVVKDWADRENVLGEVSLLVNATSLGMTGKPELPLNLGRLPTRAVVADIVYAPLMTPLLATAQQRGNSIVDGLGMLIHQARPAFKEWFGVDPEVTDELRRKLVEDLKASRD